MKNILFAMILCSGTVHSSAFGQESDTYSGNNLEVTVNESINGIKIYTSRQRVTGKLVSIRRQGLYNGCGVPVGTDSIYSKEGMLQLTITYKHSSNSDKGCHQVTTHRQEVVYFISGKIRSTAEYHQCYECEAVPCGLWVEFDSNGSVLRRENKGKCKG